MLKFFHFGPPKRKPKTPSWALKHDYQSSKNTCRCGTPYGRAKMVTNFEYFCQVLTNDSGVSRCSLIGV